MDRLHIADFGGADHAVDLQVTVAGFRSADTDRLVGQRKVVCAAVGFAEDGNGFDPELAASADNAEGDFTSVGDQDALEHRQRSEAGGRNCDTAHWRTFTLNSGWPNSTGVLFSTSTATI